MFFKRSDWVLGFASSSLGLGIFAYSLTLNSLVHTKQQTSEVAGPAAFPMGIAVIMIATGLVYLIGGLLVKREKREENLILDHLRENKKSYLLVGLTVLYITLLSFTGYLLTTVAYMLVLMWVLGYRNKRKLALIGVIFSVIMYLMFGVLLKINLPGLLTGLGI